MPKHATRLIDRRPVAERTMEFLFERPAGFDFKAGQFVTLILPDPPFTDARGNRRAFTLCSPPQEAGHLAIATRMTEHALKRSLAEVPLGTPCEILGPSGDFTLHDDPAVPAVLIAGGIGITPLRSILLDAVARRLAHRITLVYSNRTPEGTAFHEEIDRVAAAHPNVTYVPTMTQAERSRGSWSGARRRVDAAFLGETVDDLTRAIVYVAGPPGIVAAVAGALAGAGADPARLRTDEFDGY